MIFPVQQWGWERCLDVESSGVATVDLDVESSGVVTVDFEARGEYTKWPPLTETINLKKITIFYWISFCLA